MLRPEVTVTHPSMLRVATSGFFVTYIEQGLKWIVRITPAQKVGSDEMASERSLHGPQIYSWCSTKNFGLEYRAGSLFRTDLRMRGSLHLTFPHTDPRGKSVEKVRFCTVPRRSSRFLTVLRGSARDSKLKFFVEVTNPSLHIRNLTSVTSI
jgi:hypothetical protein